MKKNLFYLFIIATLFILLDISIYAQDCSSTWIYINPTNAALDTPVCFNANHYAYALGGGLFLEPAYEYAPINADGTLGQWTTISNDSGASCLSWYNQSGIVVGNNVYVAGGYQDTGFGGVTYSSNCYLAHIGTNGLLGPFVQQPSMKQTGSLFAMAYSNGYLYRIGFGSDVEYSKVSSDGTLEGWNYTSALTTAYSSSENAFVSNGYIYTIGGEGSSSPNYFERAQQNADGTLNAWVIASLSIPSSGDGPVIPLILTADNQIYLIGNGENIYKASFDPLTGTIGTFTTDTRPALNIGVAQGAFLFWPYLYIIGSLSASSSVIEYTCDTFTQKDFVFTSSADTVQWVYESVSGTSTQPTISWLSTFNGSTSGVIKIQFTQANQGVKMTLYKAGWFGSIDGDWYEMKAQVYCDVTTNPNTMFGVGNFYNGAFGPMDISGHGIYSTSTGWFYLKDFQQSYGGTSMYPQLTFKNNSTFPATFYLESVEVEQISPPGN